MFDNIIFIISLLNYNQYIFKRIFMIFEAFFVIFRALKSQP
jgi:hypothetical protein